MRCVDAAVTSTRTPLRSIGDRNSSSDRLISCKASLGGSFDWCSCFGSRSVSSSSTAADGVVVVSLICSLYVLMGSESMLSKCWVNVLDIAVAGSGAVVGAASITWGAAAGAGVGAAAGAVAGAETGGGGGAGAALAVVLDVVCSC